MKARELTARDAAPRRVSARRSREAHAASQRTPLFDVTNVAPAAAPIWHALRPSEGLSEAAHNRVVLRRDAVFRRSLGLVDAASAALALVVAVTFINPSLTILPAAILLLPCIVVLNKALGAYERDEHLLRKTTIDEIPQLLQTSFALALITWLGEAQFVGGGLAQRAVFGIAAISFISSVAGRGLVRTVALRLTPPERCLVVGGASAAEQVARKLESAPSVNAHVIGRVELDAPSSGGAGAPSLLGHVGALAVVLAEHEVERVIIAPDSHDQDEMLHVIRLVKALGVKVSVLPRLLEVVGSSSLFDDVDGITLLAVRRYGLTTSSEFLKRLMDLVVSVTCIVVMAPLLAALAIAIKAGSRGPVLFRQPRVGRAGQGFDMFKFRSMVEGADAMKDDLRTRNESDGLFKIADDPRITRVGRFLRKTSLDELPQLFNVLKGDMSLVGPRPLVPDEDALIEGWQRRRLAVKPGMTGLWQIFGSARIPMQDMVKIDYLYGANWSLWLDLKILFRTVPYVLTRRGQ